MKKRILLVTAIIVIALCSVVFLFACGDRDNEQYTVTYKLSHGHECAYCGIICSLDDFVFDSSSGTAVTVTVKSGGEVSVIAYAYHDYWFVGWSDGVTTAERTDRNITKDITVTALFESKMYTYKYSASEGGRVEGEVEQTVLPCQKTSEVIAVPDEGYEFVDWSDGVKTAARKDDWGKDVDVQANFKYIERTRMLNYRLTSESEINGPMLTLRYGELDGVKLPVPQKDGFIFRGWNFLDTRIADENGNLLIDDEYLKNDKDFKQTGSAKFDSIHNGVAKIEAQWESEVTYPFKMLVVYVTSIDAVLIDRDGIRQHVVYNMPDVQRRLCKKITGFLKDYFDYMLDGLVDFDIEEYFTTQTITTESFYTAPPTAEHKVVNNDIQADLVPELTDKFDFDDYGAIAMMYGFVENYSSDVREAEVQAYKFESGGGKAMDKPTNEFYVYLDPFCFGEALVYKKSLEDLLLETDFKKWEGLSKFAHEFAHVCELNIYKNLYHDYAISHLHVATGISVFSATRMFLLNEIIADGERIGIPRDYWTGNYHKAKYEVTYDGQEKMGRVVAAKKMPFYGHVSNQMVFGGDAYPVKAIANFGYEFVRWSDGVMTAEREDKNMTEDIRVTAIFEKVEGRTEYILIVSAGDGGTLKHIYYDQKDNIYVQSLIRGKDRTINKLEAVPDEGYEFVGWSVGGTDTVINWQIDYNLFDQDGEYVIKAIFKKIE